MKRQRIMMVSAVTLMLAAASITDAAATALPVFGHYIGYGVVTAASSACADTAGTKFTNQLQLNTPSNLLVLKTRRAGYDATTGLPFFTRNTFQPKSGTRANQAGNIIIANEETGASVSGTYTASFTGLDPNSFGATISATYTTAGGTCTETHAVVYARSSAD